MLTRFILGVQYVKDSLSLNSLEQEEVPLHAHCVKDRANEHQQAEKPIVR